MQKSTYSAALVSPWVLAGVRVFVPGDGNLAGRRAQRKVERTFQLDDRAIPQQTVPAVIELGPGLGTFTGPPGPKEGF